MSTFKPIDREEHILTALLNEGWSAPLLDKPAALRRLATLGEDIRRRWANECSYPWADTPHYRAAVERKVSCIRSLARFYGLTLFLQTDPRGASVYVRPAPLPITDTDYSSVAQCLYHAEVAS